MKKIFLSAICALMASVSLWADEPAAEASHWTRSGDASLQFSQGYVSKNWYKGGESNFALLATGNYTCNYKNGKFTWDNLLEGKLGFVTTPSDTYHDYMSNTDLLKFTSKIGYEAGKDWFYTMQALGQTQFFPGYKSNTENEFSKFFSPAYLTVSLGMDWKKTKENISWTLFLGPIAYNLKYVNDPLRGYKDGEKIPFEINPGRIDGTQYGLSYGEFNAYDLGASAKGAFAWKVCKYITWNSQATYFSPLYSIGKKDANGHHKGYATVDWENTFDMPLNKYFSTKVYTHLRFDDSVSKEVKDSHKGWGYFQFTELLSFGLSYHW